MAKSVWEADDFAIHASMKFGAFLWRMRRLTGLVSCLAAVTFSTVVFAQSAPDLSVTVAGQHQWVEGFPTNNALFVEVGITPRSSSNSVASATEDASDPPPAYVPVQVDSELETAPYGDVPLDPMERDEALGQPAPSKRQRRSRGTQTSADSEEELVVVLTPTFVRETIRAATQAQGVAPALERLSGMSTRSRTSALLPEIRFRAGRSADQSLRLSPTVDDPYRYTQTGGVSFILEGAATFRLSRLVFASEEIGIERLRLAQSRERQRVTAGVLEALFSWQDAYRETVGSHAQNRRVRAQLEECSLRLDALTDGWFSAHAPALAPPKGLELPPLAPNGPGNGALPPGAPATGVPPRLPMVRPTSHPRELSPKPAHANVKGPGSTNERGTRDLEVRVSSR